MEGRFHKERAGMIDRCWEKVRNFDCKESLDQTQKTISLRIHLKRMPSKRQRNPIIHCHPFIFKGSSSTSGYLLGNGVALVKVSKE